MDLIFNNNQPNMFVYLNNNHAYLNNHALFYKLPPFQRSTLEEYNSQLKGIKPFQEILMESPIRCFSWSPVFNGRNNVVGFGLDNGKVVITEVNDGFYDNKHSQDTVVDKQFFPEYVKSCTCMEWSRGITSWLATGFNKPATNTRLPSLVIWDVNYTKSVAASSSYKSHNRMATGSHAVANKPLLKLSKEPVDSLAWLTSHGLTSILMVGHKSTNQIKIYDVKVGQKAVFSYRTSKETSGICCDPTCDTRVASYHHDTIVVWDTRNFPRSVLKINVQPNISKIEWSPDEAGHLLVHQGNPKWAQSRPTRLTSSPRDSKTYVYDVIREVKLYSGEKRINSRCNFSKKTFRTHSLYSNDNEFVETVAWLPGKSKMALLASDKISFKVTETPGKSSATCNKVGQVVVYQNNYFKTYDFAQLVLENESFVDVMKSRAKSKYGLIKENLTRNIELSRDVDNMQLRLLWKWLNVSQRLYCDVIVPKPQSLFTSPAIQKSRCHPFLFRRHSASVQRSPTHPTTAPPITSGYNRKGICYRSGILPLLRDEDDDEASLKIIQWKTLANSPRDQPANLNKFLFGKSECRPSEGPRGCIYQMSTTRKLLLELCGWRDLTTDEVDESEVVTNFIQENCSHSFERLLAITIWNFNIDTAIQLLEAETAKGDTKTPISHYTWMIANLSHLSKNGQFEKDFEENLQQNTHQLSPYLNSALFFLLKYFGRNKEVENWEDYSDVLFNQDIYVYDRIGFACLHLSYKSLKIYLKQLSDEVIEKPSLDGLIVTGISNDKGLKIVEDYLNQTCDIQTVLAILLCSDDSTFLRKSSITYWKERYTSLLNSWRYYFERMTFEQRWNELVSQRKPPSFRNRIFGANPGGHLRSVSKPSVDLLCRYCSKTIALVDAGNDPELTLKDRNNKNLDKFVSIHACPNCTQPLSKCSVCAGYLGTRFNDQDIKNWLVVCMKCQHGGHQLHLEDWFKENHLCPVAGCSCVC